MASYNIGQVRGAFAAGFSAAHGVEYPRGDTARRKALQSLISDPLVLEAMKHEPRLTPIVEQAKQQKNEDGYNRIRRYYALKQQAAPLVGWHCATSEIKTQRHYAAVMKLIGDLLPADDVDLYPDGKDAA